MKEGLEANNEKTNTTYEKNISEDTWITQSRSIALSRHQKKETWGTNNYKTNATYETTDSQTKMNCNRGTALERFTGKRFGWLKPGLLARNLTFNSDASLNYKCEYVRSALGPSTLSVKHRKHCGETKQRLNVDMKPEHKKTTNRTAMDKSHMMLNAKKKDPDAICQQHRHWWACAFAQAYQGLLCPITVSMDIVAYVDENRLSRSDCTDPMIIWTFAVRIWHKGLSPTLHIKRQNLATNCHSTQ